MLTILDYDMANLRSVQKALEYVGVPARIVRDADEVKAADRLVLPGVGAFADAVRVLRERGLAEASIDFIKTGKPFLGICLGLQMLFDVGYEDGEHRGLGVLGGKCVRFDVDETLGLKVPHMGWNGVDIARPSPLFAGLKTGDGVYFTHSYFVEPSDESIVSSTSDYGRPFVTSVWKDNIVAVQFHPEKSQAVGLQMLKNFAAM